MTKLIIIRGPSGVGKSTVAKALMQRTTRPTVLVDLHYTPKHASWLNIAEIELSVLARQGLARTTSRPLRNCVNKCKVGRSTATSAWVPSTGNFGQQMRASNSSDSIPSNRLLLRLLSWLCDTLTWFPA